MSMENKKIQEIDLKLPKNAKLFYIPEKDIYILRHYETNVLTVKDSIIDLLIESDQISQTTQSAINTVGRYLDVFGQTRKLSYTNNNRYTLMARQINNSTNFNNNYFTKYNKDKWSQIAEEIYNEFTK